MDGTYLQCDREHTQHISHGKRSFALSGLHQGLFVVSSCQYSNDFTKRSRLRVQSPTTNIAIFIHRLTTFFEIWQVSATTQDKIDVPGATPAFGSSRCSYAKNIDKTGP